MSQFLSCIVQLIPFSTSCVLIHQKPAEGSLSNSARYDLVSVSIYPPSKVWCSDSLDMGHAVTCLFSQQGVPFLGQHLRPTEPTGPTVAEKQLDPSTGTRTSNGYVGPGSTMQFHWHKARLGHQPTITTPKRPLPSQIFMSECSTMWPTRPLKHPALSREIREHHSWKDTCALGPYIYMTGWFIGPDSISLIFMQMYAPDWHEYLHRQKLSKASKHTTHRKLRQKGTKATRDCICNSTGVFACKVNAFIHHDSIWFDSFPVSELCRQESIDFL